MIGRIKRWIRKSIKTVKKDRKASTKRLLRVERKKRKLLTTLPRKGPGRLALALRHPRSFWAGGLAAAYEKACPAIRPAEYRLAWRRTLAEYVWDYYHDKSFFHSIRWMGVQTFKSVHDLWVYQEILHETRPETVIEIGSLYGGSTLFLAQMLDLMGSGEVISIDLRRDVYRASHPRIRTLTGDCSDSAVRAEVVRLCAGKKTMLIHDGDHAEEAVLRDLELYAPLVSKDLYLIIEDGVIELFNPDRLRTEVPSAGPLAAARLFLEKHPEFERDASREKFSLTSNPRGYLRRIT